MPVSDDYLPLHAISQIHRRQQALNAMDKWQQLIRSAKQANHHQAYQRASGMAQRALDMAKQQFPRDFKNHPDQAAAAVLVSYFTLNESYLGNADYLAAERNFKQAVDFLTKAQQIFAKSEAQQATVIRGAQQIQFEWGNFTREYADKFSELHLSPFLRLPQCLEA